MLRICYDLSHSPPTYDAVASACIAERWRITRGEPNIEIAIAPGPREGFRGGENYWPYGREAREGALENIAIPIFQLLPSCTSVYRLGRHEDARGMLVAAHGLRNQIYAGVRPLRLNRTFVQHPDLVTITLREADHWPTRNSNVPEWIKAASGMQQMGLRVVFVRDTLCAAKRIDGFEIDALAAVDLPERAVLYASARINIGVNNGPMWLAAAMDVPTVIMRPLDAVAPCCNAAYFKRCGISDQTGAVPGMSNVRIGWGPDTAENILGEVSAAMGVPCAA